MSVIPTSVGVLLGLAVFGAYAYALYVCVRKAKYGFFWLGIAGLFPLFTVFFAWFPTVGALRPAKDGSPWALSHGPEPMPAAPKLDPEERSVIGLFLSRAVVAGLISDEIRSKLIAYRDNSEAVAVRTTKERADEMSTDVVRTTDAAVTPSPPAIQPPPSPSRPMPSTPAPVQPLRPTVPTTSPPVQRGARPVPSRSQPVEPPRPLEPPTPREPSEVALRLREAREAVSADVALHGFAYLGVLLTFVGVLGFLLFSFVDLPDASQPVVELFIASVFFGWAYVLYRQEAYNVAKALELLGGAILPLVVFAGLVDGAPIPPDVTGTALVVVMPLVSLAIALVYARIARRRPETMLRYLVLPLVWLAALAAGFAWKTDEPLVSDAITRLVAPQPALAAVAIAVTLSPRIRTRLQSARLQVMFPAVIAAPVAYVLALALSVGASGLFPLSAAVAAMATLASVRQLAVHHEQERLALLAAPVLLAAAVAATIPLTGLGWAGAIAVAAFLGLVAWFVALGIDDFEAWLLAATGLVVGLGMSLAVPGAALVAFALASMWAGWRRVAGVPVEDAEPVVMAAAAALPVGAGWALWNLIAPAGGALLMSLVLVGVTILARRTGTDDSYWAWWPPAAAAIVAGFAIGLVGLDPVESITTSGVFVLVTLALVGIAMGAGPGFVELRLDAVALIVVFGAMPYLGAGWSAAVGVAAVLGVLERLVRTDGSDALPWLAGAMLVAAGLIVTFAEPWAAVVAFGVASVWMHWRRATGVPLESVDAATAFAAAALPFGFGWGIWYVLDLEPAVILLSGLVTLMAVVVRLRRVDDPFLQWWPIVPALILVALSTVPVGLGRIDLLTGDVALSTLSIVLAATTVMLGRGYLELRRWMAATLVVLGATPYLGVGWAGSVGVLASIVLVEIIIRADERELFGSVVSAVSIAVALPLTFAEAPASVAAFLVASVWLHLRRIVGVPIEVPEAVMTFAAGVVPVGLGWGLYQVLDPAAAVLVMAFVLTVAAGVTRWRSRDDVLWRWWPGAAALIVAGLGIGLIGPAPSPPLDAAGWSVIVTLVLVAATVALGDAFLTARSWAFAAILLIDLHLLLELADATATTRAVTWALLGLALVVVGITQTAAWFDHPPVVGHLVAAGAVVLAVGPTGRAVAMAGWSAGLVLALVADRMRRGSVQRLGRRLVATTPAAQVVGWIVPLLLVLSVPTALLMSFNLWETFSENRSWSGLATGGTAVVFAAVTRNASLSREVRRPLTVSATFYVVVGVAVAAPVPWSTIAAVVMSIAVAVLVAPNIRNSALSWFAWLMSGVMFVLLGERAGLDADRLRLLLLGLAVVYFVGGLVVDDRIAGRRAQGQGLRVSWLRFPVLLGALAVPGTIGSIMALEPSAAALAAIAAAAGYFGVARLLRAAAVTIPAYALASFGVVGSAPATLVEAPLLLPGVVAALLIASLAAWIFGERHDSILDEWDVPPLLVAHGVGLLALGIAAADTAPLPWIIIGALSASIGVWRRVRYWTDVGHALVIVGAAFVGVGAVAAVLVLTSLRAMWEVKQLTDWRRLVAHGVATLSAGASWVLTIEWAGWTLDATTSLTTVVFGGVAVAVGLFAARTSIRQDTVAPWTLLTGLGVTYSTVAAVVTSPGEGPALLIAGPPVGLVLFAAAVALVRTSLEEIPGYMSIAVASAAWPVVIVFGGWDAGTAVTASAWLGGLVVVAAGEAVRRRMGGEPPTAYAWGLVGFAYVTGASAVAFAAPDRSVWATAIAGGMALVAVGAARVSGHIEGAGMPVWSLGAAGVSAAALSFGLDAGAAAFVFVFLVASSSASLVLIALSRQRDLAPSWVAPIGWFVAVSSGIAAVAALWLLGDLRSITAVLLVVGVQAALVGISWQRGGILTVAPPAIGAAVLLLVAESATGVVEWYTLPFALAVLAEIELVGRYPIGRSDDAEAPDLVWAEWLAIGLGVLPGVVDMFVRSLTSSFMVFGFAAILLAWAVLTRVRRRAVAAAAVGVAAAVLVIAAALAGAAPASSGFWIIAVGLGFAVMSVAGVVEAMRSRRGFAVRRFDELMGGWR